MKNTLTIAACVLTSSLTFAQCDQAHEIINSTCFEFSDGSVSIAATGGSGTYDYLITDTDLTVVNVGGSNTATGLVKGWYYTTIDDGAGCIDLDSAYVDGPDQMDAVLIITNPTYPGACDGIVDCDTVLNHTGDYNLITYGYTAPGPFGVGETVWTDVCAGSYGLFLSDENGCATSEDFDIGSLVGIDESNLQLSVKVLSEIKSISINNEFSSASLSFAVYSLSGQQISGSEIKPGKNEIQMTNLRGLYFYTISENGKTIKSGKFSF